MSRWIVDTVTERAGQTVAELRAVEWFKPNPDWERLVDAGEDGTEFIDAAPGEEGAEYIEAVGRLTLDITNGPELHPLDDVEMTLAVLVSVDV